MDIYRVRRLNISIGNHEPMNHFRSTLRHFLTILTVLLLSIGLTSVGRADDDTWLNPALLKKRIADTFEEPKDCKSLHRENRIWINRDEQVVILDGYIVQREVPLELFACPAGSKEHEAVVAVLAKPQLVHAGLLAINAKPAFRFIDASRRYR